MSYKPPKLQLIEQQYPRSPTEQDDPYRPSTEDDINAKLYHRMLASKGGEPPDGRVSVLETKVETLEKNLTKLDEKVDKYFFGGLGALSFILIALAVGFLTLNDRFVDIESRFYSVESRVSSVESTIARVDERLKNVEKKVEKIPTKDEMFGIMHKVLSERQSSQ